MTPGKHAGTAVVIGGSLAGLFAARVLSERFESVVILERDELENTGDGRKGVPQGRHAHALLESGRTLIDGWFPGFSRELVDAGADVGDPGVDLFWWQNGGKRAEFPMHIEVPICSRPLLEETVRARVEKLENVELRTGAQVENLAATADKARVTGVVLDDGSTLDANLTLDCTGRVGRSVPWIKALGYAAPEIVEIHIDMRYTTRLFQKNPAMNTGWKIAIFIGDPPDSHLGVCFPIEGDRWMVTLCGYHGDHAGTDLPEFAEYARTIPVTLPGVATLADIIEGCTPLGEPRTHRLASDQRRLVEKMPRVPAGWAMLGDAVCSFNPIYGQGMSSAARQANELSAALDKAATVDAALTAAIHKGAAKAIAWPWQTATGGDFNHPKTTGQKAPGTDFVNRYVARVTKAMQKDPVVARAFSDVGNLVAAPQSLMKPALLLRVLRNSRG